ncbi:hypothetical protein OD350_09630 [Clostridium beijerinckii]|uniref:hypothetical protein n=1 Tax=Clostridium beijerinckii TaxID=1520 RepID=UPI0022275BB3|nr:hypothetical protein [Clostridium beijerinckii]UYZ37906.1 hypothetical protein OD350_09630 [Clostridium beijerinckii]
MPLLIPFIVGAVEAFFGYVAENAAAIAISAAVVAVAHVGYDYLTKEDTIEEEKDKSLEAGTALAFLGIVTVIANISSIESTIDSETIGTIADGVVLSTSSIMNDVQDSITSIDTATDTTTDEPKQPTIIYRMASGTNQSLTPRPGKDATGLSFNTVRPVSGNYVYTTMEEVNSTGVLVAIKDGATHVSIVPVDMSRMPEWMDSRASAETNPHPFTLLLKSITIKVKQK